MKNGRIKIGSRLSEILEEQHLQQTELIKKAEPLLTERGLKLSPSKLNQYVKDKHGPDSDMIELLAEVLHVDVSWLLGLTDTRKPAPIEWDGLDDLDRELLKIIHPLSRESKLSLLAGLKSAQGEKE